jgi:hypothetical protein
MQKSKSNIFSNDRLSSLKVIKHNTIESLQSVFWETTIDKLKDLQIEADTNNGNVVKMDAATEKSQIENNGYWGFAITDKNEIHYWAKPDVNKADLISFFAHELGHIVGTADKDDWQEELRADSYAVVALKTLEIIGITNKNTQLISAAPDLLNACQKMKKALYNLSSGDLITPAILEAENKIYEAVTKATTLK